MSKQFGLLILLLSLLYVLIGCAVCAIVDDDCKRLQEWSDSHPLKWMVVFPLWPYICWRFWKSHEGKTK